MSSISTVTPAGGASPGPSRWERLRPRLGLRARVILAFSIGALFLSLVMSGLVLGITRSNLINQREDGATNQVILNARIVGSAITPDGNNLDTFAGLQFPEGSRPVLFQRAAAVEGQPESGWSAPDPAFSRSALPDELRDRVLAGQPAKMRYNQPDGALALAIGTPIASIDAAYFEIISLETLDDTVSSISFVLFGASIATVLAGAAFGWYSSRRILRPLDEVGLAARSLAGGALDTRIRSLVDKDLEPIITSFNGMADTLEVRIEKDTQFASDVSHELRSPLMTLQASIEVLENNRDDLSERAQSALDLLAADLDRFRELVEDLLEMSRFDAGVMRLELEEVLLGQFVTHAVRASGYDVPVEFGDDAPIDPEFDDIITALDKRRIARVIANLLTNASKYGDGAVRVVIDGHESPNGQVGQIAIAVDDNGEGVPEEDRSRIFERFNRAGAANRRGTGSGVGLGLALVDEHVRLHGGHVSVTDAPDGGARFVVVLPRVEIDDLSMEGDMA